MATMFPEEPHRCNGAGTARLGMVGLTSSALKDEDMLSHQGGQLPAREDSQEGQDSTRRVNGVVCSSLAVGQAEGHFLANGEESPSAGRIARSVETMDTGERPLDTGEGTEAMGSNAPLLVEHELARHDEQVRLVTQAWLASSPEAEKAVCPD